VLRFQTKLEVLGAAASNLSYFSDITLCESLQYCRKFVKLDVRSNPHGEDGVRALLRLLMQKNCGLSSLNISRCRERYYSNGEKFRYQFENFNTEFNITQDPPN